MTTNQMQQPSGANPLVPILATVFWLLAVVVAAVPVLMSVMIFDSGTENASIWAWLLFYGLWAFLGVCLLTVPVAWIVWAITRKRAGRGRLLRVLAALLPLIPLAVAGIGILGTVAGPCQGNFSNC
jgi:ABC-type Fe3+ transport system permease subunit